MSRILSPRQTSPWADIPSDRPPGLTPTRQTPTTPADGYCIRRYESYWNAPPGQTLPGQISPQTDPHGQTPTRQITPPPADPPNPSRWLLHRTVRILLECILVKWVIFLIIRIIKKMGLSPILSVIHTVTVGTMLNFKSGNNRHGLKKRYV